jgi:general secretion pathway protein C
MSRKLLPLLFNALMAALVAALAAWWALRIFAPAPAAPPPPLQPVPSREADPVAAARMFGKVEAVSSGPSSIQAVGVYSDGAASSAVLVIEGRPPRVVLIGQEVAPGLRLVAVTPQAAVLESGAGRQEVRVPERPPVAQPGPAVVQNFSLQGNVLTAPSSGAAPAAAPPLRPGQAAQDLPPGTPVPMPPGQPLPRYDSPTLTPPPPLPMPVPQPGEAQTPRTQ